MVLINPDEKFMLIRLFFCNRWSLMISSIKSTPYENCKNNSNVLFLLFSISKLNEICDNAMPQPKSKELKVSLSFKIYSI